MSDLNRTELAQTLLDTMSNVAVIADCTLIDTINDETVLLQSGLDSLGFAMLVAQLEEDLGIDPFSEMQLAVYPRTFVEFTTLYASALKG